MDECQLFFIFPDREREEQPRHVFVSLGQPPVCLLPARLPPGHLPARPHLHHHRLRAQPAGRDQGHEEGALQDLHAGRVRHLRQDGAEDQQADGEAERLHQRQVGAVLQGQLGLHPGAARHPRPDCPRHHVDPQLHPGPQSAATLDLSVLLVPLAALGSPWRCRPPPLDGAQLRHVEINAKIFYFQCEERISTTTTRLIVSNYFIILIILSLKTKHYYLYNLINFVFSHLVSFCEQ